MKGEPPPEDQAQLSARIFQLIERAVYLLIGALLVLTLLLALAGAGKILWDGLQDWSGTGAVFQLIDRLLFVLMLVEILNTVQASIRTHTLVCEPFLIVGLIACIRRILVITLETSQITQPAKWQPEHMQLFWASMTELVVLGVLVTILMASIYLNRRTAHIGSPEKESSDE